MARKLMEGDMLTIVADHACPFCGSHDLPESGIRVMPTFNIAFIDDKVLQLSKSEAIILAELAKEQGKTVSAGDLRLALYDRMRRGEDVVRKHVNLLAKLLERESTGYEIVGRHGQGWVLKIRAMS